MQKEYDIEIRERYNFHDEIVRISNKLHDNAAQYIVSGSKQHQSIHKLRLCLKKLRGIIRLLRHEISATSYNELNTNYSDIARQVANLRDYTSQITLLRKMHGQLTNSLLQTPLKKTVIHLIKKRNTGYKLFLKQNEDTQIQQKILSLKDKFQSLRFNGNPDVFILLSLRKVYKKANRIRKNNELWQNPQLFHCWRKQVKYLMFQLMMVNHVWPKQYKVYIEELKSLQKILGSLHDMYHFKEILKHETNAQINAIEKNNLLRLINRKEHTLMQKADMLGKQLFAESSKSFAKRIYKLWIVKHPPVFKTTN